MDKKTTQVLQIELMLIETSATVIEKNATESLKRIEKSVINREEIYQLADFILEKSKNIGTAITNILKLEDVPEFIIKELKSANFLLHQIGERVETIYPEEKEENFRIIIEDILSFAYKIIQRVEPLIAK
ncbi:MAG: hypothetical protein Q8R00_03610 [Candidatus Nanoarchaeia archaeon]|nr:hypothetical protein [Candidatus Nanoarchaeia archaeon]